MAEISLRFDIVAYPVISTRARTDGGRRLAYRRVVEGDAHHELEELVQHHDVVQVVLVDVVQGPDLRAGGEHIRPH
eukprot:COSAG01_NODE_1641_length_9647_cov_5.299539_4_plen_76_part_00